LWVLCVDVVCVVIARRGGGGEAVADFSAVIEFAYGLAAHARIFTLSQVARHPLLREYSQPQKRASEVLRSVANDFERMPGPYGEPHRFRLTPGAKRRLGVEYRNIAGDSSKVGHWLAIGDVWAALRLNGGVSAWMVEPAESGGFDIFFAYGGRAFVAEVQRTPIRSNVWRAKWKRRMGWLENAEALAKAPWQPAGRIVRPKPVLVDLTGQTASTVGVPLGVLMCKSVDDLPGVLRRYIEKTKQN
jgi:hypothetical protein